MLDGQFVCLGTIQHLKSKFSQGYMVETKFRSDPPTRTNDIKGFLDSQQSFDMEIRELSDSSAVFQIKQATPAEIIEFFEQYKQMLPIEKYSITQTSLEQIFLSFGKRAHQTP